MKREVIYNRDNMEVPTPTKRELTFLEGYNLWAMYMNAQSPVEIKKHTDEWIVVVKETNFWLGNFNSIDAAERFCKLNKLQEVAYEI